MPNSRKEFEYNMFFLKEKLENNQIVFNEFVARSMKGISNVKFAPNRRVNFHTVDEMARLIANMMTQMSQQEGLKSKENGEE